MEFFILWFAFSIAVSLFATVRRNRNGAGWLILAMIISPLLAGIFLAILKELPPKEILPPPMASGGRSKSFFGPAVIILVMMIIVFLGVIASHTGPKAHQAKTPITHSTP